MASQSESWYEDLPSVKIQPVESSSPLGSYEAVWVHINTVCSKGRWQDDSFKTAIKTQHKLRQPPRNMDSKRLGLVGIAWHEHRSNPRMVTWYHFRISPMPHSQSFQCTEWPMGIGLIGCELDSNSKFEAVSVFLVSHCFFLVAATSSHW